MRPLTESASIVLLGSFNPAIFQPSWLALKRLISPSDAQTAEVKLIAPQFAQFKAAGFLVEAMPERFLALVEEPQDQVRLRDLVIGIFDILDETPIARMGLNWTFVFKVQDEERWHGVGDRLAPKEIWSDLLRGRPGLRTMTIQGDLAEGLRGKQNVKVEPANTPTNGVRIEINNDIAGPSGDEEPITAATFVELIRKHWDDAQKGASRIATEVLTKAGGA
jgi:hypothetical protein